MRAAGSRAAGCGRQWAVLLLAFAAPIPGAGAQGDCKRPLYLTFDTGHMEIAPLVAEVLKRQQVRVSFFAANERTKQGDGSLGDHWAPWWRARAAEGHEFASHTWSHVGWRADLGSAQDPAFRVRPSAGPRAGQSLVLSAAEYCAEIARAADRLQALTGRAPLPLFRAPGGKTSPRLLASARACGYTHVGWSPTGFLGDELASEQVSNAALLRRALQSVRSGDILLAHLGIWSRKDPWAPAVLEPLIVGLKQRGFCFRTLREHPDYAALAAPAVR
ncbi:polysaccharide deacetylase family protein [Verminephrobacter aporrectodeae subsp. tuberculatae]|uniref:polysaccharide deacetylase family protein n=1 Tax=Verminephrobacter aporrectodeae TaxID=1110389 RepID=UPI0022390FEA|nr:polysaccharide deacetylase family protein [Verminephrobacter aporrectodeae]MCW5256509.1 polysaccharide deacetylase family protein [Verminephrobacter aporrectodeae subsp. tuberculatae]